MAIIGAIVGAGGAGFQLFVQKDNNSGIYANAAARDVYFGANPDELARLDENQFLIIKLNDNGSGQVAYQQRANNAWVDVTSLVQGETGPPGATGNSFFFNSIAERDTFFGTPVNEALLENGLPVVCNVGDETASTFIWGGPTSPTSYDPTLWRLASLEANAGSLILGTGGAKIASGNKVLYFVNAEGEKSYVAYVMYDDTGSETPFYWELAAIATFNVGVVSDTTLSDPQSLAFTSAANAMVTEFVIIPAETGTLRVQGWVGTDETGPNIFDAYFEVLVGDVGNQTPFILPNDVLFETATQLFFKFSGIDVIGGEQTAGPYVGETILFLSYDAHNAIKRQSVCAADGEVLTVDTVVVGDGNASIKNVERAVLTESINSTQLDLESGSVSGTASYILSKSTGGVQGTFIYNEPDDEVSLVSNTTGGIEISAPIGIIKLDSANAVGEVQIRTAANDLEHPLSLGTTGSNSAIVNIYTTSRNPEGNITAPPGSVAFRADALNSTIYCLQSATASNTGWIDALSGGINGPPTSVVNSLVVFDVTDGTSITGVDRALLTETALDTLLVLSSGNVTGNTEIRLDDSTTTQKASWLYVEPTDITFLRSFGTGGFSIFANVGDMRLSANAGDVNLASSSATGVILAQVASPDTNNPFSIETTGTNGAKIDFYATTRNPEGLITADPGSVAFRADGVDSDIYVLRAASTGNTGWTDILAGAGDVTGPATSIANTIAVFDTTDGTSIDNVDTAFLLFDGLETTLTLVSGAPLGAAQIGLANSSFSTRSDFVYDEDMDKTILRGMGSGGLDVRASAGALTFETGSGSTVVTSTLPSFNEFEVVCPSPTGTATYALYNSLFVERFSIQYNNSTNVVTITDSTTNTLDFVSQAGYTFSGSSVSGIEKLFSLTSSALDGGTSEISIGTGSPQNNITGTQGDLHIRTDGTSSIMNIYRGATEANNFWRQMVVAGEVSTTNAFAYFVSTDGQEIASLARFTYEIDGNDTSLKLSNSVPVGAVDIGLYDSSNNIHAFMSYNEQFGDTILNIDSKVILLSDPTGGDLIIQSGSDTTGGAEFRLKDFNNVDRIRFFYDDATNNGVLEVASPFTFENTTAGDDITIQTGATAKTNIASSGPNTNEVLTIASTGTNGQTSTFYVSAVTPQGNISPTTGGALCHLVDGLDSDLFVAGTAGAASAWSVFLKIPAGGPDQILELQPNIATGNAGLRINNSTGFQVGELQYDQDNGQFILASTNSGLTIDSANDQMLITSNNLPIDFIIDTTGDIVPVLKLENTTEFTDLWVYNDDPNGVITANDGDLLVAVNGVASNLYMQKGSVWYPFVSANDIALGSIQRLISDGVSSPPLNASPTAQIISFFTTDGPDFGILTSNQASNQIDITDVVDTVNGDLYEINAVISAACSTNNDELTFIVYVNDGVTDTATNLEALNFFDNSDEFYTTTVTGFVRGPTSITGTGAFKLFFSSPDSITVEFWSMTFTAKRLL